MIPPPPTRFLRRGPARLTVLIAALVVVLVAALVAALIVLRGPGGYQRPAQQPPAVATTVVVATPSATRSEDGRSSTGPAARRAPAWVSREVASVATRTGAALGLSVSPVTSTVPTGTPGSTLPTGTPGSTLPAGTPAGEARPWTAGTIETGPAWSTIKVPLVMATLAAGSATIDDPDIRAAIISSDNSAAEALTRSLGSDAAAATAVRSQLSLHHDTVTVPADVRTRTDVSVLGQTGWRLDDQTVFMASTACTPRDAALVHLMGQIETDQRWGLGRLPGARFKGGWGPDAAGRYLVRQTGIVTVSGQSYAISMAAQAADGSFAAGTSALDELAVRLPSMLGRMPGSRC